MVQIYARSKQIGGEHGSVTLFGPDLRDWPCRFSDAFCILQTESVKADNAKMNAEMGESNAAQ